MKKGYIAEKIRVKKLAEKGWFVKRVSGSIGAEDIVAVRKVNNFFDVRLEQVKSTKNRFFYIDERTKSEVERLTNTKKEYGIPCFVSFSFKCDYKRKWKIFDVDYVYNIIENGRKKIDLEKEGRDVYE